MSLKPILFNDEMVRAILAGRKTQTRRPVTRSTCSVLGYGNSPLFADLDFDYSSKHFRTFVDRGTSMFGCGENCDYLHVPAKSWWDEEKTRFDWVSYRVRPLMFPGDVLWVRECWTPLSDFDPSGETGVIYRADYVNDPPMVDGLKWRPSIHMPRWAARIFLRVTEVRCHCLHDITDADAIAEGFESANDFVLAWDSIYDATKYGANPWLFAFTFERCEEPSDSKIASVTNFPGVSCG